MGKFDFNIHNWRGRYLNENISETSVNTVYDQVVGLSADEMEELLHRMGEYFHKHADVLTSMNAVAIGDHLLEAYNELKNRTGN